MDVGHAYYSTERRQEALGAFATLIERNPNFCSAHAYRAVVLSELGRLPEARAAWDRASQLSPGASLTSIQARSALQARIRHGPALTAAHRAGMR